MKHVLVTGVSSGVGEATAEALARAGYHVFGSVRHQEDAIGLRKSLGDSFTPLIFDVTNQEAVRAASLTVGSVVGNDGLAGLVNNAGICNWGPLMDQPLDEVRQHFEINVIGLLGVTQAFLPILGAGRSRSHTPGRIVNLSSVGGKITFPFIGAYGASKHAVESLSDGMRRELALFGIDVIVIQPGTVRTLIWGKLQQMNDEPYRESHFFETMKALRVKLVAQGNRGMPPETVAQTVRRALESKRPKARYALPDRYLSGWWIPRLLPDRWLDRAIVSMVGLKRPAK